MKRARRAPLLVPRTARRGHYPHRPLRCPAHRRQRVADAYLTSLVLRYLVRPSTPPKLSFLAFFQDEIKPGTVDLANDIVKYARRVEVIYKRLIGLLVDYQLDGRVNEIKLQALVNEWGSGNPSEQGAAIQQQFKRYIDKLKEEADERTTKAGALQGKLTAFQSNLKQSGADFGANYASYQTKYGEAEKELNKLRGELTDLAKELEDARKKERDEMIVLGTSPLYLLIPFFGPLIMGGILLGVGIDFGLLKEKIKAKINKAEEQQKKANTEQTFFAAYTGAKH